MSSSISLSHSCPLVRRLNASASLDVPQKDNQEAFPETSPSGGDCEREGKSEGASTLLLLVFFFHRRLIEPIEEKKNVVAKPS